VDDSQRAQAQTVDSSEKRTAIIVLGMHRSGSSAASGLIHLLGADAPTHLEGPNSFNPKGYWESSVIMRFNDRLLQSVGSDWKDWSGVDVERLDPAGTWEAELAALIQDEFGESPLFVLKDPRFCRIAPLLFRALSRLSIVPRIVITVRNPLESARSLYERDNMPREDALLLWLRHVLDAELASRRCRRCFILFDDVLSDWRSAAERLATTLDLAWPERSPEADSKIEEFLAKDLRHHGIPDAELDEVRSVLPWVPAAYDILRELAVRHDRVDSCLDRLGQIKDSFDEATPAVRHLLRRRDEHAARVAAMSSEVSERNAVIERLSAELSAASAKWAEQEALTMRLSAELSAAAAKSAEQEALTARLSAELSATAAQRTDREIAIEAELSALRQQMQGIGKSWGSLIRERTRSETAAQKPLLLLLQLLAPLLKQARKALGKAKAKRALQRDYLTIKLSGLFDADYYLSAYADLRGRVHDPIMHYLRHGAREKRNPSRLFETTSYLRNNPDVAASIINPVVHFVIRGLAEGRSSIPMRTKFSAPALPEVAHGELRNPLERIVTLRLADGILAWRPEHISDIQRPFLEPSSALGYLRERQSGNPEWTAPIGSRIGVYASTRGNYFFNEIRDIIAQGLREAGYEPILLTEKDPQNGNPAINMVVAPHEFFTLGDGERWLTDSFLSKSIIVNTEQWQTQWFAKSLPALLRAKRIFDINLQSAAGLRSLGLPVSFLPIGFVQDFAPFSFHARLPDLLALKGVPRKTRDYAPGPGEGFLDRPLDVAFIGTITPRREAFFASNAAVFAKYRPFLYLPRADAPFRAGPEAAMTTEATTGIEQRSKIVLNIHRDDDQYFEWHRIVLHGVWQRSVVVTEKSHHVPGFVPGQHYFEGALAEIPEMLEWLLRTDDGQAAAESARQSAYALLSSEYRLSSRLADLLGSSAQHRPVAQPNRL
jgi:hypothetical protein